jgi:hypothetical protein
MRIEGSEVTTLITGVVVLFSALAASSNKAAPADRWQRGSVSKDILISKVRALSELIVYLPTASDHIVRFNVVY